MTKFWPVSLMLNSPALEAEHRHELTCFRVTGISEQTMLICRTLACQYRGMDITMLHSEGVSLQRVYLKHPTPENWLSLERNVFIDTGDNFGFNVAPLH